MNGRSPDDRILPNRSMPPGSIIPELAYGDVLSAADWLCSAFGFRERMRIGRHRCQLVLGDASIVVISLPGGNSSTPGAAAGAAGVHHTHGIMVRVANVDEHYNHVKALGGTILSAPETFPFGERQYSVQDPGGHRWTFTQSVEDVDPAEWGGEAIGGL